MLTFGLYCKSLISFETNYLPYNLFFPNLMELKNLIKIILIINIMNDLLAYESN